MLKDSVFYASVEESKSVKDLSRTLSAFKEVQVRLQQSKQAYIIIV